MHNTIANKIFFFLPIFIATILACNVTVNMTPPAATTLPAPISTNTAIPATGIPTQVLASVTPISVTVAPSATSITVQPTSIPVQPTSVTSATITVGRLSLVIPPNLARGASGGDYPRVDNADAAYWQKTPGHLQVALNNYILQGTFHQPQIYVYPAMTYVELVPAAFESMHRLRNAMNPGTAIDPDQLPSVPFFNAAPVFASNIQAVSFQNGSGIRFLTEYAQYPAPVNNHELFYQFQGFTNDGEYYVVAILPITAPVLAETSDAGSPLPSDGVQYPFFADPNTETLQKYYGDVANLLNATRPKYLPHRSINWTN